MVEDRERGRRWISTAVIVVVLAAVAAVGGFWLVGSDDSGSLGSTPFGPVLAEIRTCPSELPQCPDVPVDEALDEIGAWLDDETVITLLEAQKDLSPETDLPPEAFPARGGVTVRIARTSEADRLLAELVTLPVVDFVVLGTADQPPSDLQVQERPEDLDRKRTLSQVSAPVEGADESVVFETWEPTAGAICQGRRPSERPRCSLLIIDTGAIGVMFAPPAEEPGCLSVTTGPGVDHVRVSAADGTRLDVAATQLVPNLTILKLHVACWSDTTRRVTGEVVGPDGSVLSAIP